MRLSWNEIRVRAARFAEEWRDARYERGESQTFYNEFFEIFGVTRRRVASFEEPVRRLGNERGFIDLFWKGVLIVEQKSAGGNLIRAKNQALDYFPGLKETELPRFVLVSDFQQFELYDLEDRTGIKFRLEQLPKKIEAFSFILGVEKRVFKDQDPANIKASELLGRLHDALRGSGYVGHNLERFLVRLLFCLFSDDTGIFEPRDMFLGLIEDRTREDGSDLGNLISQLFQVLNTPTEQRQRNLDEDLQQFPYINGDLFRERLAIPAFDSAMRELLLEACKFNWDAISPAIFGSLFQSVMDDVERREQGAHYTTEKNILKVIQPLFLDDLREDFQRLKRRRDTARRKAMEGFQARLAGLTFFDPACGCGNFLIIAYREIRALEIEVLKELFPHRELTFDVSTLSRIDVDQFYGIEINEFPVRIAEVALWMMDHIMNNRLSLEFGQNYARIPLRKAPHIHHRDALEMDWEEVLDPERCSHVLGNPPFSGAKMQSDAQRSQVRKIARLPGSGGTLDYVTAWFIKAGDYIGRGQARIGFVATNSIVQGEQVGQLWPILFNRCRLEIAFAHRTFAWGSDARGVAHVHVVIIGLVRRDQEPQTKRLFSYSDIKGEPTESVHSAISPYLFDASGISDRHLVVRDASEPLADVPRMVIGSKPIDDGNYILDDGEKDEFLRREPGAKRYLRPYIGSKEFINGGQRWILALQGATPRELRAMPSVVDRMRLVRAFRQRSTSPGTVALGDQPERYHVEVIPEKPFLVVPEASSELREYVPIGWLKPPTIPSNLVKVIVGADLWHFGVLTSTMHMAWLRHIGGRLKSDYRYSSGIVYNTFPWPSASESQKDGIKRFAQAVLDARALFPDASLADLYDTDVMHRELRAAHARLDTAVDRLYRRQAFGSDRERVELLFVMYESLVTPLIAAPSPRRRRRAP